MSGRRCCCSRLCLFLSCVCAFFAVCYWLWPSSGGADGSPKADRQYDFNVTYARHVIDTLCRQYRRGVVAGDLCNRLCYDAQTYELVDFHSSNKVVAVLLIGGQKHVLKSRHAFFSAFERDGSGDDVGAHVLAATNRRLELGWQPAHLHHLLDVVWPPARRNRNLSRADADSLHALLSQDEYVTFAVLPSARVFPKVMGTCGHFYAVEYLVPFRMKSYYTNLKAKILVHLMGTLKLFYEFLNEPLHWCDVKFDNFGLSADYPKRFLLIDGDMLFTQSRMDRLFGAMHCRDDDDCIYLDCKARCDKTTGHCTGRVNDNVDVFCEKLVKQLFGNFWTKSNRYLAACHDTKMNSTQRLRELRLVWAWSLSDV